MSACRAARSARSNVRIRHHYVALQRDKLANGGRAQCWPTAISKERNALQGDASSAMMIRFAATRGKCAKRYRRRRGRTSARPACMGTHGPVSASPHRKRSGIRPASAIRYRSSRARLDSGSFSRCHAACCNGACCFSAAELARAGSCTGGIARRRLLFIWAASLSRPRVVLLNPIFQ